MNEWSSHPELRRPISWLSTGDPGCPYFEVVDGINREVLIESSGEGEQTVYALTIGGAEVITFDEWPSFWHRPPG